MLRPAFTEALKTAMRERDTLRLGTVRMILAGLKERDIEARGKGNQAGVGDDEIMAMLQKMVKQRQESAALYDQGGRAELAEKERGEIAVIESFLPKAMDVAEVDAAIAEAIAATGAAGLKDMGRVMASLRERHAGRMDFAAASAAIKAKLAG